MICRGLGVRLQDVRKPAQKAKMAMAGLVMAFVLSVLSPDYAFATASTPKRDVSPEVDEGLIFSQSVIGKTVGDVDLKDSSSRKIKLSDLRGKPLIISPIYTGCQYACTVITTRLADAIDVARDAMGEGSFNVLTVGFDTANDTVSRMRNYAASRGVLNIKGWHFVSGDKVTVKRLMEDIGFSYKVAPWGFDHIAQVTLLDADGKVYRQVYGENFGTPHLVEPIKELVFGTEKAFSSLSDLIKSVQLYCTIYDPSADRYKFDYSLFFQILAGVLILTIGFAFLGREFISQWRKKRKLKASGGDPSEV